MKSNQEKILEASLAIILLSLIIFLVTREEIFIILSVVILVLAITFPSLMRKPAKVWYNFSEVLGLISNIFINTFIYLLLLVPISFFRKCIKTHTDLNVKDWNKSKKSSFVDRDHIVKKDDLENLF